MENALGPCRLPYKLEKVTSLENNTTKSTILDKGYLLSTRDLCGLDFIPSLIDAGVMCFKIEGRMKTPEYVATVTRIYRKYIDLALSSEKYVIDEQDKKDLAQVFNRGGFSNGHLSNEPNRALVYSEKPNHIGIYLGNVSNYKPNKCHVFLSLNDTLSLGDTIQFEKENSKYTVSELIIKNKNISSATSKQYVEIGRMKGNINIGDKIFKVSSKQLSNNSKFSYEGENKKIPLKAKITIKEAMPISLNIITLENDNTLFKNINITNLSDITPVIATNKPVDRNRIISQLSKTNNTIFNFEEIQVDLDDGLFIPSISSINELRRTSLEEILNIAKERIPRTSKVVNFNENIEIAQKKINNKKISLLLNNLNINENYNNLQNIDKLYIPLKYFANKKFEKTILNLTQNFSTYIYLPTIIKANYSNILENAIENSLEKYNIKGFVVSNISSGVFINKIKNLYKGSNSSFEFIANFSLNVYNNYTKKTLKNLGVNTFTISPELDKDTINKTSYNLLNSSLKSELIVYGKTPLMSTNYCFLGKTNRCYPTCKMQCKESNVKYYLVDRLGLKFRIIPDSIQTVTTIYNSKTLSLNPNDFNVNYLRVDILDETVEEINYIIETLLSGNRLEGKEFTNGNLNREI